MDFFNNPLVIFFITQFVAFMVMLVKNHFDFQNYKNNSDERWKHHEKEREKEDKRFLEKLDAINEKLDKIQSLSETNRKEIDANDREISEQLIGVKAHLDVLCNITDSYVESFMDAQKKGLSRKD